MKLIKVKNGLLEAENFFLVSSFSDFAGSTNITRNINSGNLQLITNNQIERKFTYGAFVIELKKQNWDVVSGKDYCACYVGNDECIYGIRDDISGINKYWKITCSDNYIQVFASNDKINWRNLGGTNINGTITKQGFIKDSNNPFVLEDYKVYENPFITIQNFPEGTIAILQDKDGNELKRRVFDSDMQVQIFLDSCMSGKLVFTDASDNIIYSSDIIDFIYGDLFVFNSYELEIIYKGIVVLEETEIDSLLEKISIKNVGTKNYTNLTIGTQDNSNNTIKLSFDGINYYDKLTVLNIDPLEQIDIYVEIIRNPDNHGFQVGNFQLNIQ